jgi:hypothetical protein
MVVAWCWAIGEVVAMAVKELPPLVWRAFAESRVALSEEGAAAKQLQGVNQQRPLTTTGVELAEGAHHWLACCWALTTRLAPCASS